MFYTLRNKNLMFLVTFELSSANAFRLGKATILLSGKGSSVKWQDHSSRELLTLAHLYWPECILRSSSLHSLLGNSASFICVWSVFLVLPFYSFFRPARVAQW